MKFKRGMKLCHTSPGEIAPGRIWVLFDGPYMYDSPTILGLIRLILREWRNDRHLVG